MAEFIDQYKLLLYKETGYKGLCYFGFFHLPEKLTTGL